MNKLSIDFYLKKNVYGEFITDLYRYLLESKKCIYVKLICEPEILKKPKVDILSEIFDSYTCQDLKESTFYLENLYDETTSEDSLFLKEVSQKCFGEYQVTYNSFLDNKLIEGTISDFSYSNIKNMHELNCNQIMFFTKMNDYNSIILGVYDYQTMFCISDVDKEEIKMIKKLYDSKFNVDNLKINIYENDVIRE